MEKIISINFQGRVIPIEETAYNNLKQYIDSLRRHFANEESGDEIINDIENRIAELFTDRIKHGARCIGSADVASVIDSIGRIEDIEAAENEEAEVPKTGAKQPENTTVLRERFFRNEDDKVIAGICSGIAIRTGMDPVVVRVLFVLLFGAFFWVYILLWIIVPSKSVHANITRRLYRNPDDKVVAGVCGGLAAYFNMESRTVRLIFVIPLIIGVISRGMHWFWWHWSWGFGPRIFLGSFGSALLLGYIILWIAVPYASSAADKLEMRGEKVDLNSIKAASQARASSGNGVPARHRSGLGHVIGILFKAFFLLIAGSIAIGLFGGLIGLVFGGMALMPFTHFFLDDFGQHIVLWIGLALFLGVPFLALITWLIRRMTGTRSKRHYIGYVFAVLWLVGLVSTITLAGMLTSNFSSKYVQEDAIPVSQPATGKLYINNSNDIVPGSSVHYHRWFRHWNDGEQSFRIYNDSLWLNTVKVKVTQSEDSLFHIYKMNISRGSSSDRAKELAAHINFNIYQHDSIVTLPRGFYISSKDKFRNQQVMVVVEVPVGKSIKLDNSIKEYDWFNINVNGHRNFYFERDWNNSYYYRSNRDYMMTPTGLKNLKDTTSGSWNEEDDDDDE
jgi:phage shock protein PspC (stress-responsive transcriptional regulator)